MTDFTDEPFPVSYFAGVIDNAMRRGQRYGHDDDWDDEFEDEWNAEVLASARNLANEVDGWL